MADSPMSPGGHGVSGDDSLTGDGRRLVPESRYLLPTQKVDGLASLEERLVQRSRELEASEARFRSLVERNADAIILVDKSGTIRFVNPAAEKLFGRRSRELIGEVFGFPVVDGETTELEIITRAGEHRIVEMRVVETEWADLHVYLASLRDITERKQAEEARTKLIQEQAARQQAEAAVRQRDEFLELVAHELRTPLTGIRAASQLALRQMDRQDGPDPYRLRNQLDILERQSCRLSRLVSQLLDTSRLQAGQVTLTYQLTNVADIVANVAASAQAGTSDHQIIVRAPLEVMARVDPLRMEQVLTNLLDNAIRYSPDGGAIIVELVTPRPDTMRISVTDHGMGIAPEHRHRIFSRFHQAHRQDHRSGLGVGLYVAHQLVALHGGQLSAEFPSEGGACFTMTLPAEPESASLSGRTQEHQSSASRR